MKITIRGMPPVLMRLLTPQAVNKMIGMLIRHRQDVWPENAEYAEGEK